MTILPEIQLLRHSHCIWSYWPRNPLNLLQFLAMSTLKGNAISFVSV